MFHNFTLMYFDSCQSILIPVGILPVCNTSASSFPEDSKHKFDIFQVVYICMVGD